MLSPIRFMRDLQCIRDEHTCKLANQLTGPREHLKRSYCIGYQKVFVMLGGDNERIVERGRAFALGEELPRSFFDGWTAGEYQEMRVIAVGIARAGNILTYRYAPVLADNTGAKARRQYIADAIYKSSKTGNNGSRVGG
jgi:hypothetical protein